MSAEKLLAEIAARPRHRGALFLDIEDMLEIDAALAAGQSQDPYDLVTRESAVQAIEHVTIHNGGGRDRDARNMLVSATQPQAPQGAVTGWQPIETAPAMKTVLACNRLGYVGPAIMDNAGRWNHIGAPTHWMPLPAAPETPEGKK